MNVNNHQVNKYRIEAIGRKVLVEHPEEGGKSAWFQGHVSEWNGDEHRIEFTSEKDHVWANLETWERDQTLVWMRTDFDREQVANHSVGRTVLIKFPIESEVEKQKRWAWFLAEICDIQEREIRKKGKQIVVVEHLVKYDADGAEEWLNLWEAIKRKKLQFLDDFRGQDIASNEDMEPEIAAKDISSAEGDVAAGIAPVGIQ